MRTNYTQKTLTLLRDEGYTPWIVERWIPARGHPGGGKRVDLYHLLDIIAYADGQLYGIQSTGPSGHASHRVDMLSNEHLPGLLRAGHAGHPPELAQALSEARRQGAAVDATLGGVDTRGRRTTIVRDVPQDPRRRAAGSLRRAPFSFLRIPLLRHPPMRR